MAMKMDLPGIIQLLKPLVKAGTLIERTEDQVFFFLFYYLFLNVVKTFKFNCYCCSSEYMKSQCHVLSLFVLEVLNWISTISFSYKKLWTRSSWWREMVQSLLVLPFSLSLKKSVEKWLLLLFLLSVVVMDKETNCLVLFIFLPMNLFLFIWHAQKSYCTLFTAIRTIDIQSFAVHCWRCNLACFWRSLCLLVT